MLFFGSSWGNLYIYNRKGWLLPGVALGSPRKPYNALQGWASPKENGLGDPGAQLDRFQGIGPQPYGQLDAWAGPSSSAKVGGEGTSRASTLRFGRKGDKGPRAAGRMGGRSGCGAQPSRPRSPAGRRRGRCREARTARPGAAATSQSWRPGRDPGKALAPDWRPPRGRSVGEPVAPEARDAPRAAVQPGSRAAPPECNLTGVSPVGRLRPRLGGQRGRKRKREWGGGGDRERGSGVIYTNRALS